MFSSQYDQTALHRASRSGHTDVVKLLVDSGAQLDYKDYVSTKLSLVLYCDISSIISTPPPPPPPPHTHTPSISRSQDGWTALDLASNNDHTDVVKVLLASGAHHGIKYLVSTRTSI